MMPQTRMLIEHSCARLQNLYCAYADRSDIEGFVSLFTPDASITVPEHAPFVGHDAIRAAMTALAESGVAHRHIATNALIDVHSETSASGSCYLIVYNSAAPGDAKGQRPIEPPATVGYYDDVFALGADGWKFQSRVLTRVFRRMDDPLLVRAANATKN